MHALVCWFSLSLMAGAANEQHYMIPTEFYQEVLGGWMVPSVPPCVLTVTVRLCGLSHEALCVGHAASSAYAGPYMKYSCGYWPSKDTTFEQSETEMLSLYCQKAELQDGMKVGSTWQQRRRGEESRCGG